MSEFHGIPAAAVDSAAKKLRKFARHKYEITDADAKEAVLCVLRSLKRPSVSGGGEIKSIETTADGNSRKTSSVG